MALKSTVHKAQLQIADMDRNYYEDHQLILACHSSETETRLMMRLLAFSLNAQERLEFANGISDQDEPDLWVKTLTGEIDLWIQVGQPDEKALLKACGRARKVLVYAYNQNPRLWWEKIAPKLAKARNLEVYFVEAQSAEALGKLADRTMDLQVMIQDGEITLRSDGGEVGLQVSKQEV